MTAILTSKKKMNIKIYKKFLDNITNHGKLMRHIVFFLFFISGCGTFKVVKKSDKIADCKRKTFYQGWPFVEDVFATGTGCQKYLKEKGFISSYDKERIDREKKRIKDIKNYVQSFPKFKKYEKIAIDKKIKIGMPEKLLFLSWGYPNKINKTVGKLFGVHKQCIYKDWNNSTYVYIENGLITSWQN